MGIESHSKTEKNTVQLGIQHIADMFSVTLSARLSAPKLLKEAKHLVLNCA
jgi:hypothetical protein